MSNEKLREALELCRAALDNLGLAATLRKYAIRTADEALATTEPEPTGMPELPEPHAVITGKLGAHCSFNSSELRKGDPIYTADQMRAAMAQGVKG